MMPKGIAARSPIYARQFIDGGSAGDFDQCRTRAAELDAILSQRYDQKSIEGYTIVVLKSEADAADELVTGLMCSQLTYPCLFIRIQPVSYDTAPVSGITKELDLRELEK